MFHKINIQTTFSHKTNYLLIIQTGQNATQVDNPHSYKFYNILNLSPFEFWTFKIRRISYTTNFVSFLIIFIQWMTLRSMYNSLLTEIYGKIWLFNLKFMTISRFYTILIIFSINCVKMRKLIIILHIATHLTDMLIHWLCL